MALKDVHDNLDDIPAEFQSLYTEKGGKYELTGIVGIKTSADVERVQLSLNKERADHKDTKSKLATWADMDHAEVLKTLDRIPELEAASKGKLDEAQIEEIVTRRVDGTIKSKLAPVERKLKDVIKERDTALEENTGFRSADKTRRVHDKVRTALTASKVLPDAHEDALLLADHVFEIRDDDGAIVTKSNITNLSPGLDPAGWLTEIQEKRGHWWPASVGGGSRGSTAGVGGPGGANPWSAENWNMTKQGAFLREHGTERAGAMAKAAGTVVGGQKPTPKKAALR